MTATTLLLALAASAPHSAALTERHEAILTAAIKAHHAYTNRLLSIQGESILPLQANDPPLADSLMPHSLQFNVSHSRMFGWIRVTDSLNRRNTSPRSSAGIVLAVEEPTKKKLELLSQNTLLRRQAHEEALLLLLESFTPWSCDPILTENNIIFEKDGVSVAGSITLQTEYGRLTNIFISWPPTEFEPLSWPAVSAEEVKANLRKLAVINPENQILRLEFRFGYPLVFQENLGNLTGKELASRPHGLPHWVASIYTRTSHGSIRLEQYTFSSLTGELLSGPVPFLGSTETQSLLPGIYTLPNGWKATLSPAEPPQSTSWQPTTLKNPNGDTLKAETDPNLRFYKINGTTYLRSRIPG
jgi:hypothetical protein